MTCVSLIKKKFLISDMSSVQISFLKKSTAKLAFSVWSGRDRGMRKRTSTERVRWEREEEDSEERRKKGTFVVVVCWEKEGGEEIYFLKLFFFPPATDPSPLGKDAVSERKQSF